MTIVKFEDLIAWQKAQDLAVNVYKAFGQIRDFDFRNQVCSASVSISNNIAEGFDSKSKKEFGRFLGIARNSCNEVQSMCYLAERLNFVDASKKNELLRFCEEVIRIIVGLSKSLQNKIDVK